MSKTAEQQHRRSPTRLRANAIGLIAAATLGIVFMGPVPSMYGVFGPITTFSGGATAFLLLLGGVIVLPTAICYARISREIPSAGSAYTWLGRLINKHTGNWLGWMMLPYYILVISGPSIIFGLFFNVFLNDIGFDVSLTNFATFSLAVVLCFALAATLAILSITVSTRAATAVVAFELLVMAALAITIIARNVGDLTLAPFNPAAGNIDYTGFWIVLPIAFATYTGFDVISVAAEETRLPRSAIPRATILSVIMYGLFMALVAYAFLFAAPFQTLVKYTESGITPIAPIATKYWGGADILVAITGMTAGLGATLAIMVGASRIMFAMGRDDALPSSLSRLTAKYQTPYVAIAIVVAIGLLFDLIVGKWIQPLFAYFWGGTAITWFALTLYIFVNIGYFVLVYRDRSTFTWTKAIIPALGVIFSVAVLYKSFLQALWNAGWVTIGRGIVVFALVWTILGFGYAYLVRNRAKTPRIEAEVPLGEPDRGGARLGTP